jgi:hypothetical protein
LKIALEHRLQKKAYTMNRKKRTVRLKTSVPAKQPQDLTAQQKNKEIVHINFVRMDKLPQAEHYGITDPSNKQRLNAALQYMQQINEPFFQWLEQDAAHAILFAQNPLEAMKTAIPDLDESIFNKLSKDIFL